jgi:hypothetical protein
MTVTRQALQAALAAPIVDGKFSDSFIRFLNDIVTDRSLNAGTAQPRTILNGGIEKLGKFSYYSVDTESAAASDNLDTISGANEGDLIFIKAANSARTVVIRDGQGNILTKGGASLSLDNTDDLAILFYDGTAWKADLWDVSS